VTAQARALGSTDLIDRLVQVSHNVKAVQDVQGLSGLLGHHRQIGLPHVAAHVAQTTDHLRPQFFQAPSQRGLAPSPAHPQQTTAMFIDLVNHRQKLVGPFPLTPVNLVNAQ